MIFQLEYVYCKSDLHWQREIRSQQQGGSSSQDTSGPHQQQARHHAVSISGIRKGGQTGNRFLKRRCYNNRVIHHMAASRGGPENPRTTRVKRFPTGNRLTVGAIHPQIRCRGPFFPASSREKRARERNHDGSATI